MDRPRSRDPGAGRSGRVAFADRLIGWRRRRLAGVSGPGSFVAVLFYAGSLTPSLLPRPWWLQGVIAAICAAIGYVIGVALGAVGGVFERWSGLRVIMRPRARVTLLTAWFLVLAGGLVAYPFATVRWQQFTSRYVGLDPPGPWHVVGTTLAAVAAFASLLGLWRLIAGLFDWLLVRVESRVVRESIARVIATVATVGVLLLVLDRVLLPGGLALAHRAADRVNAEDPVALSAPTSPLRSGGPGSSEAWESLGQDGKIFVSAAPTAGDIAVATGRESREPIRLFVGVGRPTLQERLEALLAEMDRTGAFQRKVVDVQFATSTGYLNLGSVAALEFLTDGDCATVSLQYSTLPSALGLLTAGDDPPQAARVLLGGVAARIAAIDPAYRPQLVVGGESLGAYGGNGAFDTPEDLLARVDGAVWTGTPNFTPLHATITARRTLGSTEVNPVVDNGRNFRFAQSAPELLADHYGRELGAWQFPRIVYLQHDSDPVTWWSPSLLFDSPEWLRETRRDNPMSQMSWITLVTFWQVTADLAVSNEVPDGYGHRYGPAETVPAWAGVLGLDPAADYSRLEAAIGRLGP